MRSEGARVVTSGSSLNSTPSGERVQIGFFGVRNAGKSSLVNAVTGQDLAVVSNTPGTTTDPVRKAMELLPVGPVLIVDTPGIDDEGELGGLRVEKARRVLDSIDVAVLVVDSTKGLSVADEALVADFQRKSVPYVIVSSKADLAPESTGIGSATVDLDDRGVKRARIAVSVKEARGIEELKGAIASLAAEASRERKLVSDLVETGDAVVLVVPIDSAAPKGRLILPQQQVIRDLVEAGAHACVTSVEGLGGMLAALQAPPRFVVTDSQAFGQVARIVPEDVPLTSFSILMARYKGTLAVQIESVDSLAQLGDASRVLVSEGCTHHRQCGDIGTVKIPRCIRAMSGASPQFSFTSGGEFPRDVSQFDVVVHCGGCMLNAREMEHRMNVAVEQGVPFANYGMVLAKANGVLERSLAPLANHKVKSALDSD